MKLSVLVSAVSAFAVASAAVVPNSDFMSALTRRQTSADCAFYCDALKRLPDACDKDVGCLCSPPAASVMYTCATCELKVGADTFSGVQSTLISYSNDCAQLGHPVGALALSAC